MSLDEDLLNRLAVDAGLERPAIVVRGLELGAPRASLQPELEHYPASMIKVPIAFALEDARERGFVSLDDRVTIDAANMTTNDAPSPFVPGYVARLGELATAMLAASDNVATNVLVDVLGRSAIGEFCARLGLRDTYVRRKLSGSLPLISDPHATGRNAHPASDAAMLFERLARRERAAWIYDALAAQVWNDKVAKGLARGDRFAHKTGDTDEVSHDGGLLTTANGRRFVLVVYTALPATPETDARHAAFARALRPHLMT